jgi:hypothetical protein
MNDSKGKELAVGQTVKECWNKRGGKSKITALEEPFVYVRREYGYDDSPIFPEDLIVVDTHDVCITITMNCETEAEAAKKIKEWVSVVEGSLPADAASYNIEVKL